MFPNPSRLSNVLKENPRLFPRENDLILSPSLQAYSSLELNHFILLQKHIPFQNHGPLGGRKAIENTQQILPVPTTKAVLFQVMGEVQVLQLEIRISRIRIQETAFRSVE